MKRTRSKSPTASIAEVTFGTNTFGRARRQSRTPKKEHRIREPVICCFTGPTAGLRTGSVSQLNLQKQASTEAPMSSVHSHRNEPVKGDKPCGDSLLRCYHLQPTKPFGRPKDYPKYRDAHKNKNCNLLPKYCGNDNEHYGIQTCTKNFGRVQTITQKTSTHES
jgi:hypothetical protein